MAIPRKLFQTWKSKTDIPENFAYWSKTLITQNPEYEYVLWDDADNRKFIEENYSWFLPTYDAFPAEIYRADAIRYFFLYHFGGIYADMDVECIRPLDDIANIGRIVLGSMGTDQGFEHSLPNVMMFSEAREEFWLLVFSMMMTADMSQRPEYVTGPVTLRNAFLWYTRDYREDRVLNRLAEIRMLLSEELSPKSEATPIAVLPSQLLYPLNWDDKIHETFRVPLMKSNKILDRDTVKQLFPRSYAVTYWSHSWEPQNL